MGSFGDKLKKEREQRSISLDDISLTTKIGTRMLRALEEEKFDQLPGGIFNKGFVRAYARHVGLDEEQAIADYMAALGESQVQLSAETEAAAKPAPGPERRGPASRERREDQPAAEIPWGLLALLLLLVALAFASWSYYHRDQSLESRYGSPPMATRNATAPATDAGSPPAGSSSGSGASPVTAVPVTPLAQSPQRSAPEVPAGTQPAPPANTASQSSAPQPGTFTVLLKGNEESEESWVSIAIDGRAPIEAILTAPRQKEIQGTREVVIKVGNVGALDFFFNGKKLPSQGEYGTVRTLTFHPDGLQPLPPKPAVPPSR
jgi:cytoskeleton protein RodZ